MDLKDWFRYHSGDGTLPTSASYNVTDVPYYSAYNIPVKTWNSWKIHSQTGTGSI